MDDVEERLNNLANEFVKNNSASLRYVILEQMKILASEGIVPYWTNFIKYGNSWKNISARLSVENQFRYRDLWMEIYRETMNDPF